MARLRYFIPFLLLTSSLYAYVTFKFPENPQKVQRDFDDIEQEIKNIHTSTGTSVPIFSIASFTDGQASTIEINTGVWKAAGAITFQASYNNGPAAGGTVSGGGFSGLVMTNSFQGPTATTASVNFPSVGGTVVFTLAAFKGTTNRTASITHAFNNDRYYGLTTISGAGTYTSSDVRAFGTSDLVNSIPLTFTVNATAGEYIAYGYPARLGTATFFVGGFAGGFLGPQVVSVTNGSGYTENYNVYTSVNSGLGSTTVTVVTP